MIDVPSLLGWIGMAMVLLAYARRESLRAIIYVLLNLVGSVFIAIVCFHQEAWPPLALNCIWFVIAVRDLIMLRVRAVRKERGT